MKIAAIALALISTGLTLEPGMHGVGLGFLFGWVYTIMWNWRKL